MKVELKSGWGSLGLGGEIKENRQMIKVSMLQNGFLVGIYG